ncbi:hypothetical protein CS022_24295 [Veronia nyctiphanis]|uniref:Uncharacterized protein n=1 Tax=Veronia nyctiphanis TaxID=1278244 RepID=A0A4Q0YCG5_9GAMM|nr:hypothetical protein [Veronia nyctiphanis]RXJ68052.1 hypothetical protein CS022_24295 [Veronia nyctiphanis]
MRINTVNSGEISRANINSDSSSASVIKEANKKSAAETMKDMHSSQTWSQSAKHCPPAPTPEPPGFWEGLGGFIGSIKDNAIEVVSDAAVTAAKMVKDGSAKAIEMGKLVVDGVINQSKVVVDGAINLGNGVLEAGKGAAEFVADAGKGVIDALSLPGKSLLKGPLILEMAF